MVLYFYFCGGYVCCAWLYAEKQELRLNGDPQHLLKDRNAISFYKENNQEQPLLVASKHSHNGYVVWEVLAARMDLGYKSSGNVRGCLTVKGSIFNEPDI